MPAYGNTHPNAISTWSNQQLRTNQLIVVPWYSQHAEQLYDCPAEQQYLSVIKHEIGLDYQSPGKQVGFALLFPTTEGVTI